MWSSDSQLVIYLGCMDRRPIHDRGTVNIQLCVHRQALDLVRPEGTPGNRTAGPRLDNCDDLLLSEPLEDSPEVGQFHGSRIKKNEKLSACEEKRKKYPFGVEGRTYDTKWRIDRLSV
jgi:hypothetical protein